MNSQSADIDAWSAQPAIEQPAPRIAAKGILFNGFVVIFSLAVVLAFATASECRSIMHLPSLLYGLAIWGWWACVACVIWRIGKGVPLMLSLTPKSERSWTHFASALSA